MDTFWVTVILVITVAGCFIFASVSYVTHVIKGPVQTRVLFKDGSSCIFEVDGERGKVNQCLYQAGETIKVEEQQNHIWKVVK